MEFPNVVHPTRIRANGCIFEVVAFCSLTDRQVKTIVRQYLRNHKITAKDRGKVIRIVTTFDKDSARLL